METDTNKLKEHVKIMESVYDFIQEIAHENDYVLCKVYGTSNMQFIIQDNSLKELYEKWLIHKKPKINLNNEI